VFASGLKDLMEKGGKEKQFIASQTGETPVSGGKGWQFYATCFANNNENGCKDPRIKGKNLHTKTQGTGILVASLQIRR
jgi:hypothetical protein